MKRFFSFLAISILALASSFYMLASPRTIKASSQVQSVGGDLGSYSASSYDKALIGNYYADMFDSVNIELDFNIPSGLNFSNSYTNYSYQDKMSFGDYSVSASDSPLRKFYYTLQCQQVTLPSGRAITYFTGANSTGVNMTTTAATYGLTCRRYISMTYFFDFNGVTKNEPFNFYSSTMSPGSSYITFLATNSSSRSRMWDYFSTSWQTNKLLGYVLTNPGTSASVSTYMGQITSANSSIWLPLDTSLTNLNSATQPFLSVYSQDAISYESCSRPSDTGTTIDFPLTISFGGLSYSTSLAIPKTSLSLQYNGSSYYCSFNTTYNGSIEHEFLFSDILADNLSFVLNGLTQNTSFYNSDANNINEYSLSNFTIDYNGVYYNTTLPVNVYITFNFKLPFNWAFNGLILRSYVKSEKSSYSIGSINWLENDFLTEVSWVALHGNTYSLYNWLLLFDDYRFPSSNYLQFAYSMSDAIAVINQPMLNDVIALNFNFVYLNDDDITHFTTIYGASYKNCKAFDILCYLQNGFTYIIYEMPVISPIINFVQSGISSITSFGDFIGVFSNNAGFGLLFGFISVPITWLVIKKIMGGDD